MTDGKKISLADRIRERTKAANAAKPPVATVSRPPSADAGLREGPRVAGPPAKETAHDADDPRTIAVEIGKPREYEAPPPPGPLPKPHLATAVPQSVRPSPGKPIARPVPMVPSAGNAPPAPTGPARVPAPAKAAAQAGSAAPESSVPMTQLMDPFALPNASQPATAGPADSLLADEGAKAPAAPPKPPAQAAKTPAPSLAVVIKAAVDEALKPIRAQVEEFGKTVNALKTVVFGKRDDLAEEAKRVDDGETASLADDIAAVRTIVLGDTSPAEADEIADKVEDEELPIIDQLEALETTVRGMEAVHQQIIIDMVSPLLLNSGEEEIVGNVRTLCDDLGKGPVLKALGQLVDENTARKVVKEHLANEGGEATAEMLDNATSFFIETARKCHEAISSEGGDA